MDDSSITVLNEIPVDGLEASPDEETNSSAAPTDEWHDWWFVRFEGSVPLLCESTRARTLILFLDAFLPSSDVDLVGHTDVTNR